MPSRPQYSDTRDRLIEAAATFSAQHGIGRPSIAAVARLTGINRTTAYYYFSDRVQLVDAVNSWTATKIEDCILADDGMDPNPAGISAIALKFPGLVTTLLEDLLSARNVRSVFSRWDRFAAAIALTAQPFILTEDVDPDVLSTVLLTSLLVAPLILKTGLKPPASAEQVSIQIQNLIRQLQNLPKSLDNRT